MATPGIEFDGVWKKYRRGEVYDSLRDLIPAVTRRLLGRGPQGELGRNEFWALQDISFTVSPGEALGIIGANGAGKSTVLKTLTRIIRPTRGSCRFTGRVGALIEVAAGFHPDLTGRENVFLQGAIMGMPMELIRRNFDAIVEFSGVEAFIDTPVKRYSSGMSARLGFSIAVHLDPEILVIDEVLAVGDMEFQQRAFDRLSQQVKAGIPVVIVSHQLERIADLCTKAILLRGGRIETRGSPSECIAGYYAHRAQSIGSSESSNRVVVESVEVLGSGAVQAGSEIAFRVSGFVRPNASRGVEFLAYQVRSAESGKILFETSIGECGEHLPSEGPMAVTLRLEMNVGPGVYTIEPYLWSTDDSAVTWWGTPRFVHVLPDPRFNGVAHLNPRVQVESLL